MDQHDIFLKLSGSLTFKKKKGKREDCDEGTLVKKTKKSKGFFEMLNAAEGQNEEVKESDNADNKKTVQLVGTEVNLRKKFRIFVEGSDIPDVVAGFEDLSKLFGFNSNCIANIHGNLKFTNLTPVQMQVIPAMIHRREVMVCAPTGSGKTLAFLLPLIHHLLKGKKASTFRGLIVCPTRELAVQIYKDCNLILKRDDKKQNGGGNKSLKVQLLDKEAVKSCKNRGMKNSKGWDLLISTPNSVAYLLNSEPCLISLDCVEWLVIDESDKMFEVGKSGRSFREQLGVIYSACTNPQVRRAVFSATFAYDVQQWCVMNMDNVLQVTVGGRNTAVESIDQRLEYVGNEAGKRIAIKSLIQKGFKPPALIFVQSKQRAKDLYAELVYDELNIDVIHADRTPAQREEAIVKFRKAETWVLICTEILGRGIDIKGCNLVINYDFPTSAISYIHRIGRTGRAGRHGEAITYFTDEDRPLLRSIANVIREAGCKVPEYMLKLKKMGKEDRKKVTSRELKRPSLRSTPGEILNKKKKMQKPKKKEQKNNEKKEQKNNDEKE